MKSLALTIVVSAIAAGCASPNPIRSKWSDKNLRVAIDSDSISANDYVAIQTALVKEGRFMVVDRGTGFKAVKTEQERLHRNESDRYSDKEKWAIFGRLYGVGSIITANTQCFRTRTLFSLTAYVNRCKQFLSLVDSNTGEVVVAVDSEVDSPAPANNYGSESFSAGADWTEVVQKLVDAYPKDYKPQYYSEGLVKYQEESKEEARRQKETVNEKKGQQEP